MGGSPKDERKRHVSEARKDFLDNQNLSHLKVVFRHDLAWLNLTGGGRIPNIGNGKFNRAVVCYALSILVLSAASSRFQSV